MVTQKEKKKKKKKKEKRRKKVGRQDLFIYFASEMCMYDFGKFAKNAILILEREATRNAYATLDRVVAVSEASPSVRQTARNFFFRHMLKKSLGSAEETNKQQQQKPGSVGFP